MKKIWIFVLVAVLLSGCGAQPAFETVADVYAAPEAAPVRQVMLELPEDAAAPAMENEEAGKLYLCDGYTLTVQTLDAGDLDKTLRTVTGYAREKLQLIETAQGEWKRYACVWTSAGEDGDQVGRAVVLDDGSYHYVVTVMAPASEAGGLAETWQEIFDSFALE